MSFTLPPLPYQEAALEPTISSNTVAVHYGKHHQTYVTNLNKLTEGTPYATMSLEEVIKKAATNPDHVGIFNNAAQVFNHTFYWNSITDKGASAKPTGKIAQKIDADFGSFDKFREAFVAAATTQFGSGWAWLVLNNGKLEIIKTSNAATPLTENKTPILTIDVWEHAYYLDYKNLRVDYINNFLDKLINWDFANQNLG